MKPGLRRVLFCARLNSNLFLEYSLETNAIIYQDDYLLAANKPAGMPVHGSRMLEGRPKTLITAVRESTGRLVDPVHRLDRPVSGAILFSFDRETLAGLSRAFEQRAVQKTYIAIVRGWPDDEGVIDYPLNPPKDERRPDSPSRSAVTRFRSLARVEIPVPVGPYPAARYSLVELVPETGRRHQLRRHMKHISHHLLGDTTYGRGEHNRLIREHYQVQRLMLHAWSLEFRHPATERPMRLHAPLDTPFRRLVKAFGWTQALDRY